MSKKDQALRKSFAKIAKNIGASGGLVPSFADLKFVTREDGKPEQALVEFDNGYTASICRGPEVHGGDQGLLEIGILKNNKMCYKTGLTDDVLGNLTPEDVTAKLKEIAALP